jgi:iron complex outermembrane recepter protein
MKKLIAIATFNFLTLLSFAQTTISGRIVDAAKKPAEFVTVTLNRAADSVLVKGAITDADGKYQFDAIKNGNYFVIAQQVGFKKAKSTPLSISGNPLTVNDLELLEDSKTLKAVTITAQKPFIEQQLDKTVVNVENSAVAAGSTALEVLEKSPNVIVDSEGKIQLRGKNGVMIMIDGRPSQLSPDQLANLLRNTNANLIQKIEISTQPSAKYDAAGNAGIINIVMKKNSLYGTNGQVSTTYGQGVYYKSFNSINLNHREGKLNAFGSFNYNNRANFNVNNLTRLFRENNGAGAVTDSFVQTAYNRNPFISYAWRGGLDYNLSKKTIVGVVFNGSWGGRNLNLPSSTDNTTIIYAPNGSVKSELVTINQNKDKWQEYAGNANLKHTFDSTGRELTFDADYYNYYSARPQDLNITIKGSTDAKQMKENNIEGRFDIKSLKMDYTHPLSKMTKFELGAKSSWVKSDQDIQFFNTTNGVRTLDRNITNNFVYEENINAVYGNWKQEMKHGFSYQLGLRLENTNIVGTQITLDTQFTRHYTSLFPTAFAQQKFGKKDAHAMTASYSRRVDRPNYQDLNPFRDFLDQYTFQLGNPNLTPQFSHNFELGYSYMGSASLSVNYSKTNDVISQILKQNDERKESYITKENIASRESYGVTMNIPAPIKKWWFVNLNVGYQVSHYKGVYLTTPLDIKVPALQLNMQQRFTFKNDWSAELSGWYVSRINEGIIVGKPMGALNAGVSKQLLDKRLTLRLNMQDIFWTQRFRASQKIENLDLTLLGYSDSRQVRFTASYRFGNQKVQGERRRNGGANDEKNRVQKNG